MLNTHIQYIRKFCVCVCVMWWLLLQSHTESEMRWSDLTDDTDCLRPAMIHTHTYTQSHTHLHTHSHTLRHHVGSTQFPPRVTSATIWNLSNNPFNWVVSLQGKLRANNWSLWLGTGVCVCVCVCVYVCMCVRVCVCVSNSRHPCCTPEPLFDWDVDWQQ